MKIKIYLVLLIISASLLGCINKGSEKKAVKQQAVTALDIDERLEQADSLVVVFYNDPYGEDSLRYTRYYTQASVTKAEEIDKLKQQLSVEFSRQEKRNNCRGEGKIWCFIKGKIFQTLYFSTRCDNCCHIYLIKDGIFYYTRISASFTGWLQTLKPFATMPTASVIGNQ